MRRFISTSYLKVLDKNHKKTVKQIIKDAINSQDADGYTPLHLASFYGQYSLVVKYVKAGCDTSIIDNIHGKEGIEFSKNASIMKAISSLNQAVSDNDRNKFEFLLNSGYSIEEQATIKIRRPFHNSVLTTFENRRNKEKQDGSMRNVEDDELLKLINKCGGEIDSTDSDGWTALHHAVQKGDSDSVCFLLENGANIHVFSNKGHFPIHIAALNNKDRIIDILASYQADLNAKDDKKCTPLHLAAKKGNLRSVEMLLEKGSKLYARDFRKWSALHYASFYGYSKVIKRLCEYDDDLNKLQAFKNTQGRTAKEISKDQKIKKYFQSKYPLPSLICLLNFLIISSLWSFKNGKA